MSRVARLLVLAALTAPVLGLLCVPTGSAAARQSMSFVPGDRARTSGPASPKRLARRSRRAPRVAARPGLHGPHGTAAEGDDGPAARAVPGAGFTMQDGVLTYPAPARFQPQNLKRRP